MELGLDGVTGLSSSLSTPMPPSSLLVSFSPDDDSPCVSGSLPVSAPSPYLCPDSSVLTLGLDASVFVVSLPPPLDARSISSLVVTILHPSRHCWLSPRGDTVALKTPGPEADHFTSLFPLL